MSDVTPTLEQLADGYIALEKRIHALISEIGGSFCDNCDDRCCEPRHCADSDDSAWLHALRARLGVERTAADAGETGFLGKRGCMLPAGRPMICTAYICDRLHMGLHATPLENYLYQVACSLLNMVVRRAAGDLDLTELDDLDVLTPRRRAKLLSRVKRADECMTRVRRLWEARDLDQPTQRVGSDLVFLARVAPFAAQGVRFAWEPPNLSLAGR